MHAKLLTWSAPHDQHKDVLVAFPGSAGKSKREMSKLKSSIFHTNLDEHLFSNNNCIINLSPNSEIFKLVKSYYYLLHVYYESSELCSQWLECRPGPWKVTGLILVEGRSLIVERAQSSKGGQKSKGNVCALVGDWTHTPGMCSDQKLNPQLFGVQDIAPASWAPGQC